MFCWVPCILTDGGAGLLGEMPQFATFCFWISGLLGARAGLEAPPGRIGDTFHDTRCLLYFLLRTPLEFPLAPLARGTDQAFRDRRGYGSTPRVAERRSCWAQGGARPPAVVLLRGVGRQAGRAVQVQPGQHGQEGQPGELGHVPAHGAGSTWCGATHPMPRCHDTPQELWWWLHTSAHLTINLAPSARLVGCIA